MHSLVILYATTLCNFKNSIVCCKDFFFKWFMFLECIFFFVAFKTYVCWMDSNILYNAALFLPITTKVNPSNDWFTLSPLSGVYIHQVLDPKPHSHIWSKYINFFVLFATRIMLTPAWSKRTAVTVIIKECVSLMFTLAILFLDFRNHDSNISLKPHAQKLVSWSVL